MLCASRGSARRTMDHRRAVDEDRISLLETMLRETSEAATECERKYEEVIVSLCIVSFIKRNKYMVSYAVAMLLVLLLICYIPFTFLELHEVMLISKSKRFKIIGSENYILVSNYIISILLNFWSTPCIFCHFNVILGLVIISYYVNCPSSASILLLWRLEGHATCAKYCCNDAQKFSFRD